MSLEAPLGVETLDDETLETFRQENDLAAVFFYADWCGPCVAMHSQVMQELASMVKGYCKIGYLDVHDYVASASRYGVSSIPTICVFKGGKVVDQIVGMRPAEEVAGRLAKFMPADVPVP